MKVYECDHCGTILTPAERDQTFTIKVKRTGVSEKLQCVAKFDMMLRPCALLMNPSRVSEVKESIPDIEEKVLLVPSEMVPDDTFYLIDRKELTPEHYLTGGNP